MNADLIETIQCSGFKAVVVVAGGGSGAVHALLSHPGASRFVCDVRIPYSREAMDEYLGEVPQSYCSSDTAEKLAVRAWKCASRFSGNAIGISCTAALATAGVRSDPDRAFICFYTEKNVELFSLAFEVGTRREQEDALSRTLMERLYQFVCEASTIG